MNNNSTTVSIVRCKEYESTTVFNAVKQSFENIGGLDAYINPGDNVLLKVNLLSARTPEKAVTTHPVIVEEMAKAILELDAIPAIGDSPGGAVKGVKRYWEKSGMRNVADKLDIELINFETSGTYEFKTNGRTLNLAKPVFDFDLVINMPKLKTHGFTFMTLAIKNMFGAIPGLKKAEYHKENPVPTQFANLLLDVYSLCKPQLTLVDAVIGMEGQGPASGNPREIGLLLAGTDGHAIDTIGAQLIGYEPDDVYTIDLAKKRGLISFSDISIVGESLDTVKIDDFDLIGYRRSWKVLHFAANTLGHYVGKIVQKLLWVRPRADEEKCTRCQFCVNSCPVQAMQLMDGKIIIDYDRCIKCLCCHELCPEDAIEIERSMLAKGF